MPNELKPCPFCGGKADTYEYEEEQVIYDPLGCVDKKIYTLYDVECPECGYCIVDKVSEQEAIEAWNMRADNG